MQFGNFDDERREYVITRPDTPLPWMNYLGCEEYFGLISNTAGGYSFYKDARLRRLTRYRYNNAPLDIGGRYIYLRDSNSGDYWSPSWQPVKKQLDEYSCRHGMGYTIIKGRYAGIVSQTRYFVPLGENLEIWECEVTNERSEAVDLDLFASVEFCLWDANDDATNFQRNYSVGEVEVEPGVVYHKSEYRERRDHYAFFSCSAPVTGYDTQREGFLGPYRGWDHPLAVETGKCSNSLAVGWAPVGVHQVKIHLAPGARQKIIFLLGYQENPREHKFFPVGSQIIRKDGAKAKIEQYSNPAAVDEAFFKLQKYWDQLLNACQVDTPEIHLNRIINIWNAYQCMATFNMSRSASGFDTGIGRGMGFRDSTQDLLGFVHMIPEKARQRILDLASTQMENGGAYHQYQPLTKRGNNDIGSNFNDDPLWLVLAVAAYLKETADWSILDEIVPFDSNPDNAAPLFEHLERSLQYTLDRTGPHGLPLIGRADWNDCLNLNCFSSEPGQSFQTTVNKEGKTAESVLIAGLFILAAQEMDAIAKHHGKASEKYLREADKFEKIVWEAGWDGEWFRRAYRDDGKPVGSKECDEGQIFIEPQGIFVMAGLGLKDGRAKKALDSVADRLISKHGLVLHQPGYTHYRLELGEITSYPPGYKENASVFCHTNPWIMIAETRLGNADRALDYYLRINPSYRENLSEIHRCEPYVYAQMIAGKDAPSHGEAKNSWLTGTAAWNFVAVTQHILGVRPDYDGLFIQPCIPASWKEYQVTRIFRGVRYDFTFHRKGPGKTCRISVDGVQLDGNLIPAPKAQQKNVNVVVEIE